MTESTNNDRADWAEAAVLLFMQTTGTDRQDAINDLLCDLMHLARRDGRDPIEVLRGAIFHWFAEENNERLPKVDIILTEDKAT